MVLFNLTAIILFILLTEIDLLIGAIGVESRGILNVVELVPERVILVIY